MSQATKAVRVVLNIPARQGLFDYQVPPELEGSLTPGQMVVVPFNHGIYQAILWQCDVVPEVKELKALTALVDAQPVLSEAQMKLAEKIAQRSLAPLADCVNLLLTERVRKVSRQIFHLVSRDFSFQGSLFNDLAGGSKNQLLTCLLALFDEHADCLSESDLDAALGKKQWNELLAALIRRGFVKKELSFVLPNVKPLRVPCLSLLLPAEEILSRPLGKTDAADKRRRELIRLTDEHGPQVPLAEACRASGADSGDVKALEKKGWLERGSIEVWRSHQQFMSEKSAEQISLTSEQRQAVDAITAGLRDPQERVPVLLHGVTGSGKTEVYLRAAEAAIRAGKQVLMLVPEIALTPQILARFEKRFPGITGVYHSRIDDGERYDTWRRGRGGQYRIIIGPRSCLAVPLPQLGLIMVDECHEDSYYQTERSPFFSAVRAAADYAELCGAQLVLGSATPTVSQMFKAEKSGWKILKLTERATGVSQPDTLLVDMREELKSGNSSIFSRSLTREISRTLEMHRQVILFLNRRGTLSYTFCHSCGTTFLCPNCDIPYTWHASRHQLECHFCGSKAELPKTCPVCGSEEIRQFGAGVEMVESQIRELYPQAQVVRMDADTVVAKGSHEKILTSFANHETDILVGTQMVAKGLDFPDVRLVGILLADVGSNFHDYRVDEHAFQMLMQVTGRAGRSREKGLAILQTFQPERYSIRAAAMGSYERFYGDELNYRRLTGYPPFSRMLRLELRSESNDTAEDMANELAKKLRTILRVRGLRATHMIGPAPCFFPRLQNRYRWHIILRGPNPAQALEGLDLQNVRVESDPPSLL